MQRNYVKAPFAWLGKGELAEQKTLLFNFRILVNKSEQEGKFRKWT